MAKKFLVADLLCGAGGSSTGCERALGELGLRMELVCVNHWQTAIETHKLNHPRARHYVQDISTCRPHLIVPEGYLDLLMASPTCTHHSVARGGKPTSDQQRSDPWHIVTWLTELRVKRIIIENVWEFTGWGPVDARTGRPIASRKGEYFRAWIDTIRRLGFDPEWRKLNAADYGDATTRQRFILMARSDRRTVAWPVPTHARKTGDTLALFPGVKPWRPAREIIDWSIKGKSIFGRKKPLAPKTLARVYAGAVKFRWPDPFLVILRNHMDGQSVGGPLPTIAANGTHIGLAQPVIVRADMHGRKSPGARGADDPLMTLTTHSGIAVAEPFVLSNLSAGAPRNAEQPLPTITTGGAGSEKQGCARPMLVEPFVLNRHGDNGGTRAHPTSEPLPTTDCRGAGYVVEPFIAKVHGVDATDERPHERRVKSVDEPLGTQHSGGNDFALISPYYGATEQCKSAAEPLPTVTSKDRFGVVIPVTHAGEHRPRDVNSDPLPTVTGAHRGELAFITAQHGEREGQPPRVHSVDQPAPTIAASGHVDLVVAEAVTDGEHYDILFRMLEPHELAAAMGFTTDEAAYEFAGTKTEQVKQIGNAVSVRKMTACVRALMADAVPKPKQTPVPVRKEAAA